MPEVSSVTGTDAIIGSGGIGIFIAHAVGYAPTIVAFIGGVFTIFYFGLQIYDHHLVQAWIMSRRAARKTAQIAKLQARQRLITAELEALEVKKAAEKAAAQLLHAGETAAIQKVETAKADIAVERVMTETAAAIKKASE